MCIRDRGLHPSWDAAHPVSAHLAETLGYLPAGDVYKRQLLGLTGYVRGGCSPVGMKKAFPTVFDESVNHLPSVIVSAGRIGFQIECAPADLLGLTRARTAPVTTD